MNNAIRQVTAQGKFVPHSYSLDHKNEFAWLVNSWTTACVPTYLHSYSHSAFSIQSSQHSQSVSLSQSQIPFQQLFASLQVFRNPPLPVLSPSSLFPLARISVDSLNHCHTFLSFSLRLSVFHLLSLDLMFLWLSEYFVNYRVSVQSPRILISVSWCHFLNEFSAFDLSFCFMLQLMHPQWITSLQIIYNLLRSSLRLSRKRAQNTTSTFALLYSSSFTFSLLFIKEDGVRNGGQFDEELEMRSPRFWMGWAVCCSFEIEAERERKWTTSSLLPISTFHLQPRNQPTVPPPYCFSLRVNYANYEIPRVWAIGGRSPPDSTFLPIFIFLVEVPNSSPSLTLSLTKSFSSLINFPCKARILRLPPFLFQLYLWPFSPRGYACLSQSDELSACLTAYQPSTSKPPRYSFLFASQTRYLWLCCIITFPILMQQFIHFSWFKIVSYPSRRPFAFVFMPFRYSSFSFSTNPFGFCVSRHIFGSDFIAYLLSV